MAVRFFDSIDIPFVYDIESRKLWRIVGDRLVEFEDAGNGLRHSDKLYGISYGTATVLAAGIAVQHQRKAY